MPLPQDSIELLENSKSDISHQKSKALVTQDVLFCVQSDSYKHQDSYQSAISKLMHDKYKADTIENALKS